MKKLRIKGKLLVFTFFLALNFATAGGHTDGYDGITYFLYTENIVLHHSLKFHPDLSDISKLDFDFRQYAEVTLNREGHTLSKDLPIPEFYPASPILLSVISIPFYLIAESLSLPLVNFVSFFVNPLIITGTALVVFLFSRKLFGSEKISFLTAVIFSFTSFVWPYNSSMFNNPLVGLVLTCSLYYLYKAINRNGKFSVELSAFFLGLVLLAHPGYVILIPIVLIYAIYSFRKERMKILKFLVVLSIPILIQGAINYDRTSSFLDFGYGKDETIAQHMSWIGLIGALFSTGKGIFLYFPLSILFPVLIYLSYKKMGIITLSGVLFIVSHIFFHTLTDPLWQGGAWGPRYFVPLVPLISISIGLLLTRRTRIVNSLTVFLAGAGFVANLGGKLVWYMYGLAYGWEAEELWKIPNNDRTLMTWGISHSPIILAYKTLFSNYLPTLSYPHIIGDYHHLGLAPCRYDIYLYCQAGLMPLIVLGVIATIIFYFLWKYLNNLSAPTPREHDTSQPS